jgi:hypothetical protein
MAFITRDVDTDDSGDGISGTIHDNSWLQSKYNSIENPFISRSTITTTGNQTAINSGLARWLYCNNAALLTIQGMAAGTEGQRVFVVSTGGGQVDIANQNGSASAANRIITGVTGSISLMNGMAALVYDATAARWRVLDHNQGAWITPTFAAGNFTGNASMTWTLASGDVTTYASKLDAGSRTMTVEFQLITTTVAGTPNTALQIAIPGGLTAAKAMLNPILYKDNGGANTIGYCAVSSGGTVIQCFTASGGNWTASTNATYVYGQIAFEVQ